MTRYLKTLAGILLYAVLAFIALLPIMVIRIHLETVHYNLAMLTWGLCAALLLYPALAIIIRTAWFFEGKGEPVAEDRLREILLEINNFSAPIHVRRQRKNIVASWRHHEQSWCELLEKAKPKKLYELWMRFDNRTKTVILTDRYRSVDWSLSPIRLKTGRFALSRPYFRIKTGDEWGVENYVDANPEDYSFLPNEIKSPVLNTILKNGWNVRFSL